MKKSIFLVLSFLLILSTQFVGVGAIVDVRATNALNPDFGPNVFIFDDTQDVQTKMDEVFQSQYMNQFGSERYAFLFKPGNYNVNTNLGYYTSVIGLGQKPTDVSITGGIGAINQNDGSGGLNNFWRSMENISIAPTNQGQKNFWGVSQAAPIRRINIEGDLVLSDPSWSGYTSGGFIADSRITGQLFNISQQQWYTRDSQIGGESNGVWNQVFSGVVGAPETNFPPTASNPNPYTTLPTTPESKEKPYLYIANDGTYNMFVPAVRHDAVGTTWYNQTEAGTSISLDQFFIAKPTDSAATINNALEQGLNLIFTPGVYDIDQTLEVKNPNTIIYGMGLATLQAQNGVTIMHVNDVNNVNISGIILEAGVPESEVLLQVGDSNGTATKDTPIVLHDVFFRIGGAQAGKVKTAVIVNADNTILDNTWVWRGDHGEGVGWDVNTSDTGLIVNGDNVLATGLFVEHFQKYQVIWNGENGKTIMFQNEIPYDVPDQASWMNGDVKGYAAYKVSDDVKVHEAWGLGSYCFFNVNPEVHLARSFEVPRTSGVTMHHLLTVSLNNKGYIDHIINDFGPQTDTTTTKAVYIKEYPGATTAINIKTVDNAGVDVSGAEYVVKDDAGVVVATVADGNLFKTSALRFGTYTVEQTKVPEGYQLDTTPKTVYLKENMAETELVTFTLQVASGTLTVYPVDTLTGNMVTGAVYGVYDQSGALVIQKTSQSPVVFDLAPGTYTVKQLQAPIGYKLDTQVYTVEVKSNQNTEITSKQVKDATPSETSQKPVLPDTGI